MLLMRHSLVATFGYLGETVLEAVQVLFGARNPEIINVCSN